VKPREIAILGAGSWGTSLAVLLSGPDRRIQLWGRDAAQIAQLTADRENKGFLPGVKLAESIQPTSSLADLRNAEIVVFAVPSRAMREVAANVAASGTHPRAVLVSCTKGIEQGSGARMSELLVEHFPGHSVAVLSGPSHAEEVAQRMPAAVVIGAADQRAACDLQRVFSNEFFRAYTTDDVAGIELGGALKNIFAIAAGVSDGLGFGDNSKAALVTRALVELTRLGVALGGRPETFLGLSGAGDLIVTCFSQHSRNRRVGERLGRGESLAAITASMTMVAEGIPTTTSASECAARLQIETPIIDQVRAILGGKKPPLHAMRELLGRDPKPEAEPGAAAQ
jgi:glycerol-3-phosphate dehydrogenase (NAD(P)+)